MRRGATFNVDADEWAERSMQLLAEHRWQLRRKTLLRDIECAINSLWWWVPFRATTQLLLADCQREISELRSDCAKQLKPEK